MDNDVDVISVWVDNYYREIIRSSKVNGVSFSYYKSLRGYFKHSILLTDIKQQEFGIIDYKMWDTILTKIKSGRKPVQSGGLYLRYKDYQHFASKRSYFNTKKKFLELQLLIETPFKDYFILNPMYVIKLYNPKTKKEKPEN